MNTYVDRIKPDSFGITRFWNIYAAASIRYQLSNVTLCGIETG
jgi:hypothetical protein